MSSDSSALADRVDVDLELDRLIVEDACVRRPRPALRGVQYDRAFAPSVHAGYLTVQEAVQRGNREAYTTALQSRFDLPRDLAERVADGRLRLKLAVEECERRRAAASVGRPVRWRRVAVILTLVALASVFFSANHLARETDLAQTLESSSAFGVEQGDPDGGTPASGPQNRVPQNSLVEHDADGWVTRVIAAHPAAALSLFCDAGTPGSKCYSQEVVDSTPSFAGRRLGRFTLGVDGRTWVIPIQRERRTGRWAIGTGLRPIAPAALTRPRGSESAVWPYVPEFVPVEE